MPPRPTINSALLIEEVKRRPCLYDNRGVHGNHEIKLAAWSEVAAAVFSNWNEILQDKDLLIKDVQTKWKSLRDTFSRQLRILDQAKSGNGTAPNKKYIFMDQLSFLIPYINKRDKFTVTTDESNNSYDSSFFTEDQKPLQPTTITIGDSSEIVQVSQKQLNFIPIQPKPTFTAATLKPIDINTFATNTNSDSGEPPMKKVAKCLEELVAIQKEDRSEDSMGNKRFLLSLLPFMKKLPDDVNLEVRLQLMSVLQTYSGGKGLQS